MTGNVTISQNSLVKTDEIQLFSRQVNQYLQGTLSQDDFVALRLQNGIYGQRQDDNYMVRIKVPGGFMTVKQLECIADLTEKFTDAEFANITTRQDIQLHFVSMHHVPEVMQRLGEVGLTTREACGNTVRNVTACPYAGNCEKQITDIEPLLNSVVQHCMRHPVTQYLPRKFKMSISACEQDCAVGMIHDLAVIAMQKDGQIGFKIRAGGGLGHKPREAILLEEFVNEEQIIPVIESVIQLHNQYSDRKKRARSRLKFLVDRFGPEEFKAKYRDILQKTLQRHAMATDKTSKRKMLNQVPQQVVQFKAKNQHTIELNVKKGDLYHHEMRRITGVLSNFSEVNLQTLQNQNLLLRNIPAGQVDDLQGALVKEGLMIQSGNGKTVACPGAWTCRLGITSSRAMVDQLDQGDANMKIHISGCHNGCAQPQLGDIGLHGEAKRMFGYLVPYYRLYLGGQGQGDGKLALRGPEIPAARIPSAVQKIRDAFEADHAVAETFHAWVTRKALPFFTELLEDLTLVAPNDLSALLRDVDQAKEFKVLQLGGGECAGIAEETVSSKYAELEYETSYRNIFLQQGKAESAVDSTEHIMKLAADIFLATNKQPTSLTLLDALEKIKQIKADVNGLGEKFVSLVGKLESVKSKQDYVSFPPLVSELDNWIVSLRQLPEALKAKAANDEVNASIDLSDEPGPMQYLKAKKALMYAEEGQVIKFILLNDRNAHIVIDGLQKVGFKILTEQEKISRYIVSVSKPVGFKIGAKGADMALEAV